METAPPDIISNMDEYLDTLSVELLRLFCKKPDFNHYNLSQLEAMTDYGERALCSTIALLRKRNYLIIDPTYALLHPKEVKLLGDTIAADTPLCITKEGMATLEKVELTEKRYRINQVRDWATFAVSIATLIITVISLLMQLGQ